MSTTSPSPPHVGWRERFRGVVSGTILSGLQARTVSEPDAEGHTEDWGYAATPSGGVADSVATDGTFAGPRVAQPHRGGRRAISPEVLCGMVQVLDVVAIALGGLLASAVYLVAIRGDEAEYDRYWFAVVVAALIFAVAERKAGGYTLKRLTRIGWQLGHVGIIWGAAVSILSTLAFAAKVAETYSRGWAAVFALVCLVELGLIRIVLSFLIRHWTLQGRLSRVVAIVGAGPLGEQIIGKLRAATDPVITVAGVFDDRLSRVPAIIAGCQVVGTTNDLIAQVRSSLIDEVIIALPLRAEARIGELIAKLRLLPVDLRLSLDPIGGIFPIRGISQVASVQMIEVLDRPLKHWSGVVKWLEDRALGTLLVALTAPVMAVIALAIRLDSKGPILFTQDRFGFNNNVIRVYKFRTMHVDQTDPSGARRTVPNDKRVTRVGRVLRKLSLDELPQLLNVLLGDMSLVGPRPHVMAMKAGDRLYHEAVGDYFLRHRVRPGMTGWAQVHGLRGEIDTPEKARQRVTYDLWYIDNWSLWLDFKILFMTVRVILSRQNAY
jgi:Undecaprenyl-phosphate glucose phosphotransferase